MTTKTETIENTNENIKAETVNHPSVVDDPKAMNMLKAENEELKTSIRLRDARDAITKELAASGARSPDLLFQTAKDDLQFDYEGTVANAAAIVRQMRKQFPEQFGVEQVGGSVDGGAGASGRSNTLTKESLAKMKPADIAKLDWADVRQVLSER